MNLDKEVFELSMDDILPNRFQPREVFDNQALNELALSIREHGVIQPIIVRKIGDKYEIVAGERRFRASQIAGKKTIPALVRNIDDRESAKVALLENLQRKNLTSIEEARTYDTILKLDNLTQEELANNLGKSQSAVANKLRLLNLDMSVQDALLNEKISERHARSLLNVADHNKQKELLEKIIMNRMTVRQLDDEIARITGRVVQQDTEEEQTANISSGIINNFVKNNELTNAIVDIPILPETIISDTIPNPVNEMFPNAVDKLENNSNQETNFQFNKSTNNDDVPIVDQQSINLLDEKSKINEQIFFQNPEPTNKNMTIDQILANYNELYNEEDLKTSPNPIVTSSIETVEQPTYNYPTSSTEHVENIISNPIIENNIILEPIKEELIPETTNNSATTLNEQKQTFEINKNEVYDLRFAINNFRQAVQNTEKFGFKIDVEEFDFDNVYQLVIKINKK